MVRRQIGWPQSGLRRTPGVSLVALSYEEARERSRLIDVLGYRVALDVYARLTIADRYLPPGLRGAALADVTSLCRDLLGQHPAADSSGMRLVAARGLINSASSPDDIAALRSWRSAAKVPGGPDLDSRLHWQILLRLAVLGAAGRAEIEHDASQLEVLRRSLAVRSAR
jgi:hypothetical protein